MTTTTLHIHGFALESGSLHVQFGATGDGHPITMTLGIDDHPNLKPTYEAFCQAVCDAGESVLLSILGRAMIPDTADAAHRRGTCRICDVVVIEGDPGVRFDGPRAYCATHA